MNGDTAVRITAASFPTPQIVLTTTDPAVRDQLERFAEVQARAANEALKILDTRLRDATTPEDRAAAFARVYRALCRWRYDIAEQGDWTRPRSSAEQFREPIGSRSASYGFTVTDDNGSPAVAALRVFEAAARERFDAEAPGQDMLANRVVLPGGRTIDGNKLVRGQVALDRFRHPTYFTLTAAEADREALRDEAFKLLAGLEGKRAETGSLDPRDPENRRAFADAAYFLFQGPEFRRGTDATMRVFLVTAHARIFGAAPVLPQGIDLDAMIRGQEGFHEIMRDQLKVIPPTTAPVGTAVGTTRQASQRPPGRDGGRAEPGPLQR